MDLNRYPNPDIVIEVSNTSLLDDLGIKRSLYESLNIPEYWIVDVKRSRALAFEIFEKGSQQIETSRKLPSFKMTILEEALRRSRDTDQAQMGSWLLQELQK